jgi:hypothetical protein
MNGRSQMQGVHHKSGFYAVNTFSSFVTMSPDQKLGYFHTILLFPLLLFVLHKLTFDSSRSKKEKLESFPTLLRFQSFSTVQLSLI